MQILIAPDKFKGSLSAKEVCDQIALGIQDKYPEAICIKHPMADGGDGSLAVIQTHLETTSISKQTVDPLMRPIEAQYLRSGKTAFIELAEASGIVHLEKAELNPLHASTVGTGYLIDRAISEGAEEVVLLLGGSCSNDVGLGIAWALGFQFFSENGEAMIPTGGTLLDVHQIRKSPQVKDIAFKLLCDVDNPLYGSEGAAAVFGPQKGATPEMVDQLDLGMRHIAQLIQDQFEIDTSTVKGGGAAGGVAAGLHGLLRAEIVNGFQYLSQLSHLEQKIIKADLIITGEGRLDTQSLDGKVIGQLSGLCLNNQKSLYAIVGASLLSSADLADTAIQKVATITSLAEDESDAFARAGEYVRALSRELV